LESTNKPGPAQGASARELNGADAEMPDFSGSGDLLSVFKRLALTADRIMGGRRTPSPFFLTRSSGRDPMAIAHGSQRNVAYDKPSMDVLISDFKALRQIAFEKPGLIQTTQVVDVGRLEFTGHVYDLQSQSSLYLANGILSSNCEHNLNPVSRTALSWRGRTN
jgi:hypothetical protein